MSKSKGKEAEQRLYLGVDVGGTKILACLVESAGTILGRQRVSTPRPCGRDELVDTLEQVMTELLEKNNVNTTDLTAIGIAIPGVVEPKKGMVVLAPNLGLKKADIAAELEAAFDTAVVLGNDCNLGVLGEKWLGAARNAKSAVGMFMGTGIGGGYVRKDKILRGSREVGLEIGHMIMQLNGPECSCTQKGCFEALAGRRAIERRIREALQAGRTSVVTERTGGDLSQFRSGVLKEALRQNDPLVSEIITEVCEIIGLACRNVRHLFDPEVILLGGGVMEACHQFMMPLILKTVKDDPLPGAREEGGTVLLSALGDDAVVLGAVALARKHVGRSPFDKRYFISARSSPRVRSSFGEMTVNTKTYNEDIYIRVNGKVVKRRKALEKEGLRMSRWIGPRELERVCKGGPQILFIGTGDNDRIAITEKGREYLRHRNIEAVVLPTPLAVKAYTSNDQRKAAWLHIVS